jgi:hypothetical protein
MAEIKALMKKIPQEDLESLSEKQQELDQVKIRMDKLKEKKIKEAKDTLEKSKMELEQEKRDFFLSMKTNKTITKSAKFTIDMSPNDKTEGELKIKSNSSSNNLQV